MKKLKLKKAKKVGGNPFVEEVRKESSKTGSRKVPVSDLEPNPWNMNVLAPRLMEKLEKGILQLIEKTGSCPPILARPHPEKKGKLQIIDGEHRWRVHKKHKIPEIDVFVIKVDDNQAMILTATMNYLRGEKDPERYTKMLGELLEGGMDTMELSSVLPEDQADIANLIDVYGDGKELRALLDAERKAIKDTEEKPEGLDDESVYVELRFNVSVAASRVIQAEIERVGSAIGGRNEEGRALELMAVQSSQTPLPLDLVRGRKDLEQTGKKPKKLKLRMKRVKRSEVDGA